MLTVRTRIDRSTISGIGLFSDQLIVKGQVVWRFTPGFDQEICGAELAKLSAPARRQFMNYAWRLPGKQVYVLCFDDARFFNHSKTPNVIDAGSLDDNGWAICVAARKIQPGEELTEDYRQFYPASDLKHTKMAN